MEALYLLTTFINSIFIQCLFISILSIIVVGKLLKTDTRNAFAIIKWIILIYAGLNICYYLGAYLSPVTMIDFLGEAKGNYSFAFYLMLVPNTILPLFLLLRKVGRSKYILWALSFLMNAGWLLELFVIYSTDFHREYATIPSSFNFLWFAVLKGVFVGSVIYATGRSFNRKIPDIHTSIS